MHTIDLDQPATQETIAAIIGTSRQTVSDVEQRGITSRDDPLIAWLAAYIGNLRETAAGRLSADGTLDLVTERARLARAQALRVEMQNAIAQRELAPVSILAEIIARVGRQIAVTLEAIPIQLKRRSGIGVSDLEFITAEIVRARNLAANIQLDLDGVAADGVDVDEFAIDPSVSYLEQPGDRPA